MKYKKMNKNIYQYISQFAVIKWIQIIIFVLSNCLCEC